VLCDTWNQSDDKITVSGTTILDTTTIPKMRYAISKFFRNRLQSRILVITEMCSLVQSVL